MAKVKVKIHPRGLRALLRGREMQADLLPRVERIAAEAGPGMVAEVHVGETRAWASVYTQTAQAMNGEAKDRRLSIALQAGA